MGSEKTDCGSGFPEEKTVSGTDVTDEQIVFEYNRTGSIWRAGEALGISGQTVQRHLEKIGMVGRRNAFTDVERKRLEEEYVAYRDSGRLDELAADMGRTKQFICRQAGKLGLTDRRAPAARLRKFEKVPDDVLRELLIEYGKSSKTLVEWCKSRGYSDKAFKAACEERLPIEWNAVIEAHAARNNNKYRSGRNFEYSAKRKFEKAGCTVFRSPASKSPADLVVVKDGKVAFVQCKRNGAMPNAEWNKFLAFCVNAGAIPVFAFRSKNGVGVELQRITGEKVKKFQRPYPAVDIAVEDVFGQHGSS